MSITWYTSDQHFGHFNVIQYSGRPFSSVESMNAELIANFNALVHADDTVYHLGDFALDERLVPQILPQLHGTHHLIVGNHDACHPMHSRHARARRKYHEAGFVSIHERLVVPLGDLGDVLLCHMPLKWEDASIEQHEVAEGEEDNIVPRHILDARRPKYSEHRPSFGDLCHASPTARILLHGHVHERWKRKGSMCNVGVDQWSMKPVSEHDLIAFIRSTDP